MSLLSMTGTILKNLLAGPVTERYPYVPKQFPAGTRGKLHIDIDKCIFCGICQRRCPTSAITVKKEIRTWTIDRLRCVSCNCCVEVCPKKCLALDVKYTACSTKEQVDSYVAAPAAEKK